MKSEPWVEDAKCNGADPLLWDTEFLSEAVDNNYCPLWKVAQKMCAGCPVISECAAAALEPMERLPGPDMPDEGSLIFESGTVRAGVFLPATAGHRIPARRLSELLAAQETNLPAGRPVGVLLDSRRRPWLRKEVA